jgi:hypothetical protein
MNIEPPGFVDAPISRRLYCSPGLQTRGFVRAT